MSWVDELARTFGADPLSEAEVDRLLELARDVAHGVERKVTPVATFLLGASVGQRMHDGTGRDEAIDAAIGELRATLPAT